MMLRPFFGSIYPFFGRDFKILEKEISELDEKLIMKKGELKRSRWNLFWQIPAILLAFYGLYELVMKIIGSLAQIG